MRSILRKMAPMLMPAVALMSLLAMPCVAKADDYSYTIRVFAGNKGTVNDSEAVTLKKAKGETVDLSSEVSVAVSDSSYYHKGFRESGRDSEFAYRSFPADRDIDLVVSYGMRAQMARLTVHFCERGTKVPLTTDAGTSEETYEYKIGDKPVVAFKHVDGYRPLYQNITGTIRGDTDWYLEYAKVQAPSQPEETQAETTTGQQAGTEQRAGDEGATDGTGTGASQTTGQTNQQEPATDTGAENAVNGNQSQSGAGGQNGAEGANGTEDDQSAANAGTEPEEAPETMPIIDFDIPLADIDAVNGNPLSTSGESGIIINEDVPDEGGMSGFRLWASGHAMPIAIGTGVVLAIAMSLIVFLVLSRKSKDR